MTTRGHHRKVPLIAVRLFAIVAILVSSAHRLPAPVREMPEETPPSSPAADARVEHSTKAQTHSKKPSPKPAITSSPAPVQRFAGTWIGTMKTFPAGDQSTVITINSSQTTMAVDWFGQHFSVRAQIEGGTIRAVFPPPAMQPQSHIWALTPRPDGVTAQVRFTCFMNDFSAVFRRAGTESGGGQRAK